ENGDLAPHARTSGQILAGLPVFIARAVVSLKRGSVSEIVVWPDHRHRGIASALYRQMEIDLGKPLRPSRMRGKTGQALWIPRARSSRVFFANCRPGASGVHDIGCLSRCQENVPCTDFSGGTCWAGGARTYMVDADFMESSPIGRRVDIRIVTF